MMMHKEEEDVEAKKNMLNESLLDLQLEGDIHQFFVLAKAWMIQFLQDKLHTTSNDEQELLKDLRQKYPSIANSVTEIMNRCNKALYMPVIAASEREEILKQVKVLMH